VRPDAVRGDRVLQQRVAVRRRLRHRIGGDRSARAAAVLHHHRLAERLGDLAADEARDEVGRAAGGTVTTRRSGRFGKSCAASTQEKSRIKQPVRNLIAANITSWLIWLASTSAAHSRIARSWTARASCSPPRCLHAARFLARHDGCARRRRAGARPAAGQFCRDIAFLSHGTTVGTNTIIQKRGAQGRPHHHQGHEDAIHIMRGSRGYGGRDIRKVVAFPRDLQATPIVPKRLIRGISERVDCFGEIVVPLNEFEAENAIRNLVDEGVEAIAICFLWSFRNPDHELRVKKLVRKIAPRLFVTCSYDIAPKWASTSA
jgi:hypothetical protein